MRIAVISLTENGRRLSERIKAFSLPDTDIIRYCFYKHTDENAHSFDSVSRLTGEIFSQNDAIVFICACGIAVRAISPFVCSKTTDPAVIVIDDCGKFVISLLSGHIGGANLLAEMLAEKLSAIPVITTATDTGRKFSPDMFAEANSLVIDDMNAAKLVAAAVLDGETVGIKSDYPLHNVPCELSENSEAHTGIYIGTKNENPFEVTLRLVPKNIVIGIGCKKGTSSEAVERHILSSLSENSIDTRRICAAATIDIKSKEAGILEFCKKYDLPLITYPAEELMKAEGDFTSSDFVLKTTGADNVCERSAVLLSGGKLVMRKTAADGVTAAAAEKSFDIGFERRRL